MNDPLEFLLAHVDARQPLVSAEEVATWPADVLRRLMAAGLIRPAECASYVACPNCHEAHDAEVTVRDGPGGRPRFFIHCPESLRVEVPAESLRQWCVNLEGLGAALAGALSLSGRRTVLVSGRLWRLGRTKWQGVSRDVLFARGLFWPDGPTIVPRIEAQRRPIVLVADQVPPPDWWPGRRAPVVAMADVASLSDIAVVLDITDVAAAVADVDAENRAAGDLQLEDPRQSQRLRRHVKQELQSYLMDDQLVAAYREHKSYRKAAEALSTRTGSTITKDQVSRAVQRSGGVKTVAAVDDSGSVVRTVASQRRDNKRIFPKNRQPLEYQ